MPSEVKKPLFKKVKKKKQFKKRKIDDDDDDAKVETDTNKNNIEATSNNDDATNSEQLEISEIEKIQSIKKARKIKNQFRSQMVAKKIKLRKLKEADGDQEEEDPQVAEANMELKHRLEGNFAITGKSTNDEEGNVLTKKHKLAMEQYIQSQMKEDDDDDGGKKSAEGNGTDETKEVKTTSDLYAKLLEESNRMGSGEVNLEDVGSGGEVLGGTGIAEVILPVDQRLKAARETELAAARYEQERQNRQYNHSSGSMEAKANSHDEVDLSAMLPTSFGSGPANNKRAKASKRQTVQIPVRQLPGTSTPSLQPAGKVLNKNITANVGSSYSQNFRLHNEEWIAKKKQENLQESRDHQTHEEDEDAVDSGRIGFEAKRGLNNRGHQATDGHGQRIQRANDDIVYKKFISREKNKR